MKKVWEADDKFIEAMDEDQQEPMAPIASKLIQLKTSGEQLGVLSSTTFTGFDSDKRSTDPIFNLRKLALQNSKEAGKAKRQPKKSILKSGKKIFFNLRLNFEK